MIPGGVRVFLCVEPIDMRLGFDRLAQLARERVGQDPVDGGALFVFGGRAAARLKVLWFDRNGLCLLYKRYHQARFELPAAADWSTCFADRFGRAGSLARRRRARSGPGL